MSIPSFTPGYPPDGSSLGQTKSTIRDNLNGTFLTLGVDHINNNGQPGMQPAGYHNIIHQVIQSADPTAIPGVNQVYAKNYTPPTSGGVADTQLFNITGLGGVSQLTGNNASALGGWVWSGGLLFQWGFVAISATSQNGSVVFGTRSAGAIPFPNNCFVVNATLSSANPAAGSYSGGVAIFALSKTGFGYVYKNSLVSSNGFFWSAIGN